jgi:WD40 repeat protein
VIVGERDENRAILYNFETTDSTLLDHGAKVFGVAASPDDSFAATAGSNAKVTIWDASSGDREFDLEALATVFAVDFHPDGTYLAGGSLNRTIVWDFGTKEQIAMLGQAGEISAVAFSNDGKWLATASADGTIYLWKSEDNYAGEPVILRVNGQPLDLDFSPNGRWLAAGGTSQFAYLWDLSIGEEVSRLPHSDEVASVSFSNDGNLLVTGSRKVVQVWDVPALPLVPTSQLIAEACSHLTANINQSEWEVIFPGEDYRPICPDLQAKGN